MIVTGALNWWNERPEDLDACVRGLGVVADRLVALDGAYRRYPNATQRSSDENLDAIRSAAAAVNLECVIVQPDDLWAGQVEKRTRLLALAAEGSDWVATVDADHVIHGDRETSRRWLRSQTADVVEVLFTTPRNPDRALHQAVGQWHLDQMDGEKFIPLLWRALPDLRVERLHWCVSATKNGRKVWLWGGEELGIEPHVRYRQELYVEHRTLFRSEEQVNASRAFLNDRKWVVDQTGQEDDRPDLRRPETDMRFVPW